MFQTFNPQLGPLQVLNNNNSFYTGINNSNVYNSNNNNRNHNKFSLFFPDLQHVVEASGLQGW